MHKKLKIGDRVKLLGLPDWLIADLPEDEKSEMIGFVGSVTDVTDIDAYGYIWLGFGKMVEAENEALYCGHSFCVPEEFVELQ